MGIISFFKQTRPLWLILGVAVLGVTTTATVLTFYLPLLLSHVTHSQLAVGFGVGVEGIAALTMPLLIGQASDRTRTRIGRRLPFMLASTPLVVGGLLIVAFLHVYWVLVAASLMFFIGYYTYYTAYQALYPDILPSSEYGRSWAYQSVFQGIAVAIALLGGGALLVWSVAAPFVGSAVFFIIVTAITAMLLKEPKPKRLSQAKKQQSLASVVPTFFGRLREDRNLRLFLPAHFCWEYTVAAIRAFVILYLFNGLGFTRAEALPILAGVIVIYLVASLISGYIADNYDPRRYTALIISLYAAGQILTGLVTNRSILAASFPFGMFAGAAIMLLAYPILLRVTPEDRHGEYTGYYQFNRGLALLAGTSLTGFLIDRFGYLFPASHGYQVFWLVTGVFTIISIPIFLLLTSRGRMAEPSASPNPATAGK